MTRAEAATKQAAAIAERQPLVIKKFTRSLTPKEARRLAELDVYLDELSCVLHPEFYASIERQLKTLKNMT